MKIRFFFSFILVILVLVVTCYFTGLGFSLWFVHLPSIISILVFPLIFVLVLHGWKSIKAAFCIFSTMNADKKELLNAKDFFNNYCITIFSVAFFTFIISFIALMKNLEIKEELGPLLAYASISLFFAGLINLTIIMPYKIIINRKIAEMEK